jgi:hypothetical protein
MRSYTGASEDAASGRAARPGGTAMFRQALLSGQANDEQDENDDQQDADDAAWNQTNHLLGESNLWSPLGGSVNRLK